MFRRPVRDEAGVTAPSPVVMLSVVAVAMAGIALLAKGTGGEPLAEPTATPTVSVSATPTPTPSAKPKPKPKVVRGYVAIEVYNVSSIKGLAARTAARAGTIGWQVVSTENWRATSVPAPTVYYGPRLEAAAHLLGKDLGIGRIRPAVDPMKLDRLTVILDRTYAEG